MKIDKEKVILQAVDALKRSPFGATAVKIELEGRLNRSDDSGVRECEACEGEGWIDCGVCRGSGGVAFNASTHSESQRNCDCGDPGCEDYNRVSCRPCEGSGRLDCPAEGCGGNGYISNSGDRNRDWTSDTVCQDFILEYLSEFGLAKRIRNDRDRELANNRTGQYGEWTPKGALRYCYFHYDQSVDNECTMTLMITNREDVLLLPELIKAFNALGEAVGNGVGIRNAGMHLSLLNDPDGTYDEDEEPSDAEIQCFRNFRRSMSLLMPALYFLGASSERTRSLHFREPGANRGKKYSAIHYVGTTLEFRVFDTCYDKPEQVLDNFVVMKNAMRYWNPKYIDPRLDKVVTGGKISFGHDSNDRTDRFYSTVEHVDLLNAGLRKLKPSYLTVRGVKKQRGFKASKAKFAKEEAKIRKQAKVEYEEYADRFDWSLAVQRHIWIANLMETRQRATPADMMLTPRRATLESDIKSEVDVMVANQRKKKKSLEQYVQEKVDKALNRQKGNFTLSAEEDS